MGRCKYCKSHTSWPYERRRWRLKKELKWLYRSGGITESFSAMAIRNCKAEFLLFLNRAPSIMSGDLKWKYTNHYEWITAMLKSLTAHFSWAVTRKNHQHYFICLQNLYLTKFLLLTSKVLTIGVKCHRQFEVICIYCISQWQGCQQPWFLHCTYGAITIYMFHLKALADFFILQQTISNM